MGQFFSNLIYHNDAIIEYKFDVYHTCKARRDV